MDITSFRRYIWRLHYFVEISVVDSDSLNPDPALQVNPEPDLVPYLGFNFFYFCGTFLPSCIRIRGHHLIRIRNTGLNSWVGPKTLAFRVLFTMVILELLR
jgi:hypothetical protein